MLTVLVGLRKQLNNFVSPTWACTAGCNTNNNNNNNVAYCDGHVMSIYTLCMKYWSNADLFLYLEGSNMFQHRANEILCGIVNNMVVFITLYIATNIEIICFHNCFITKKKL